MKKLIMSAAVGCLTMLGSPTLAEYPEKPVNFVVPFPPGDLEDVLTRIIAEDFQAEYGVSAAVVNKPGGGGGPFPGAASVANAPADGYTVGSFVISVPVVGPLTGIPELNPNPFEPIGIFVTYPFLIASSKKAPYSSMDELAAYAADHDVVLGVFGEGLPPARVTLALAKQMGFDWGAVAAFDALDCNSLASGDADVINTTMQLVLPCLDDINILATITPERLPHSPDAPTVAELNPRLGLALWNGLFVHKDTPQDVREKIAAVARKSVASERAREVATNTGAQIYWKDAKEATAQIDMDVKNFKALGDILN